MSPSLAIGGNCRDIASCRSRLISRCGGTPVGPCPPTGHGGNALEIPSGSTQDYIYLDGIAGAFDVDYYYSVELYIRDLATLDPLTDGSLFSAGGFTQFNVGLGASVNFLDAYVYVADQVNPGVFQWTLEYGFTSTNLADVLYPTNCNYHTIEGRWKVFSGAGPSYDEETEWRLDGVSMGTLTRALGTLYPPSGFWVGTEQSFNDRTLPFYYANVAFGTTGFGSSDIWSDDFTSGLGAYTVVGSPTIVASP